MSKDLIGEVFNHLTVVEISPERKYNTLNYFCKCSCGNTTLATKNQLTAGRKKSCGCKQNIMPLRGSKYKTTVGEKYGRLTVTSEERSTGKGEYSVNCVCECENNCVVGVREVVLGNIVSCGCKRLEGQYVHGMCYSRPYIIYGHMKSRCKNPKEAGYKYYGGRGITYDPKWETFEGFWEDMKEGYSESLELDRIDPNNQYCKENCRWVTSEVQCFNTNKRKDNTSGTAGISWDKSRNKWHAYINKSGKRYFLGWFEDLEKAVSVRKSAEILHYGFNKIDKEEQENH